MTAWEYCEIYVSTNIFNFEQAITCRELQKLRHQHSNHKTVRSSPLGVSQPILASVAPYALAAGLVRRSMACMRSLIEVSTSSKSREDAALFAAFLAAAIFAPFGLYPVTLFFARWQNKKIAASATSNEDSAENN